MPRIRIFADEKELSPMEECNEDLEKLLNGLKQTRSFATGGKARDTFPNLHVKNVLRLALPLQPNQAKDIRENSKISKSNLQNRNSVKIKNVREIGSDNFFLGNSYWDGKFIKEIICEIASKFGLQHNLIVPHIEKLLYFEKGSAMSYEGETPRTCSGVGPLVVFLPSVFTGGKLTVTHGEEKETFDFEHKSEERIYYVAMFGSCAYQFEPIKSGNRLCLVYSLDYFYGLPKAMPRTTDYKAYAKLAARILKPVDSLVKRLVVVLNAKKFKQKLCFKNLTYESAGVARCLIDACAILDPKWHIFLVTLRSTRLIFHDAEPPYDESDSDVLMDKYTDSDSDDEETKPMYHLIEFTDIKGNEIERDEISFSSTHDLIGTVDLECRDLSDEDNVDSDDEYDRIRSETIRKENFALMLEPCRADEEM